jgi:hypothetical protein
VLGITAEQWCLNGEEWLCLVSSWLGHRTALGDPVIMRRHTRRSSPRRDSFACKQLVGHPRTDGEGSRQPAQWRRVRFQPQIVPANRVAVPAPRTARRLVASQGSTG